MLGENDSFSIKDLGAIMIKLIKGQNDFETWCVKNSRQYLLNEWNYEKNGDLKPSDVSSGSGKRVCWKCSRGHEWSIRIADRSNGSGCPVCSNRVVVNGYNDLQTTNPDIAAEWDYEKNKGIRPDAITCKSNKYAFWICSRGHSYGMRIDHRTDGHGCPYCAGSKIIPGFNDLITWAQKNNPRLLKRWDEKQNGSIPEKEPLSSQREVWWKCDVCGHSYRNKIKNEYDNLFCPYCNKRNRTSFPEQVLFFYIKQIFPEAINGFSTKEISEIDIYIPSMKTGIEYDGKNWHAGSQAYCKERFKYEMCQKAGIKLIRFREKIDKTNYSEICDEVIKSSYNVGKEVFENEVREFLDRYGKANINIQRDRNKIYDLYFSNLREKSLQHLFPEIAREWDYTLNSPITPEMVSAYSNEKFYFLCPQGHSYESVIAKRTGRNDGCPYCSGKQVMFGYNDLFTLFPELEKEWDCEKNTVNPQMVGKGYDKKVWWRCSKCGYSFYMSPNTRTSQGAGCAKCKGGVALKVNKYDIEGRYLQTFPSLSEAAKNEDLTPSAIGNACKGRTPSNGFLWRINPTDNNDIEPYVKKPINNKPVNQFDLDGNFIRSFVSETEAKKITGAAKVGEVCKGKRKQSGGYIWRYAETDTL